LISILDEEYVHDDTTITVGAGYRFSGDTELGPLLSHCLLQIFVDAIHAAEPHFANPDQKGNEEAEGQSQTKDKLS
jgi:hypothetical protein